MNDTPRIGISVLETFTTGMYTNSLDAIREYIQNATDSIRDAEDQGVIRKGDGRIEIWIDPSTRSLRIRDNGVGIGRADAIRRLINVGMSEKSLETDAGFRGIGRLAGIAFSSTLTFRTSAPGETAATVVSLDSASLRLAISRRTDELAEALQRESSTSYDQCRASDHFFEVQLAGIPLGADHFLDWRKLEEYLSQTVPVEFDAQTFMHANTIYDWVKQHGLSLREITVIIRTPSTERQVFKPYRTHYKTAKGKDGEFHLRIKDVKFYPEEPSPDTPFWIWYGDSELLGSIADERVAGFRLRQRNISIGGPERVAELFAEVNRTNRRFNDWYVGEIHVTSPEVIPNSRRDGFEDANGNWPEVKRLIMPFIRERCNEVRKTSEARNRPTEKVLAKLTATADEVRTQLSTGLGSKEERDALIERINKNEDLGSRALESKTKDVDIRPIASALDDLRNLRSKLESEGQFGVKNIKTNLDRKQRRVLQTVLEILYNTMLRNGCGSKREECYNMLKEAILAKFQSSSERESRS